MQLTRRILFLLLFGMPVTAQTPSAEKVPDWRHIHNGWVIPDQSYSDQPYIVKTDDGAWLCCLTTGVGREGQAGQTVMTARSHDQGRTWVDQVNVEPADGPEASYAVMLKTPGRRVYIFYNHNTDNTRRIIADNPPYRDGYCYRVDSQGYFVFKYSDDHGRTWSQTRYPIPVRAFDIDRRNAYGGEIRFFWNVGKAFHHRGKAYVPLHKVGGFGEGFFTSNEGVLLQSPNLLTETEPEEIQWQTLPDGDIGLRTPPGGGPIAAEQSFTVLSDGSFYCVYRSIDGHPVYTYSRDGGHTWATPRYKRFANGRLMKHPRAANFAWRCNNGKYLYWFHNHGGRFIREHPSRRSIAYQDRNPVWICGGVETDSPDGKIILWTQPEVLLYDDDPLVRMSYPDLLEEGGAYYVTETQKDVARVHPIPATLLHHLWHQFENRSVAREGLLLELLRSENDLPGTVTMPKLPSFVTRSHTRTDHGTRDLRAGFSVEMWFRLRSLEPGQILLDNREDNGKGFALQTTTRRTVEIVLNDGRSESRWECDPGLIQTNKRHHLVASVDGGPKIITFVVDGTLNDGDTHRQFGWGRFNPNLRDVNGLRTLEIGPSLKGSVMGLRIYGRYLLTSEAIGNFRAGASP